LTNIFLGKGFCLFLMKSAIVQFSIHVVEDQKLHRTQTCT